MEDEKVFFSARPDFINESNGEMYWEPVFYIYKEKGNTEKEMEEHLCGLDYGCGTPEEAIEEAKLTYKMIKTRKVYALGPIELKDSVYVSDPCYGTFVWCIGLIEGIKPGKWLGFMAKSETNWGIRVTDLWICNEDNLEYPEQEMVKDLCIGVDSGSAGIYDKEYYEHYHQFKEGEERGELFEEWYDRQFDERYYKDSHGNKIKDNYDPEQHCLVHDDNSADGIALDGKCVISFSGYGDGSYKAYVNKDEYGKIVGIRINYC